MISFVSFEYQHVHIFYLYSNLCFVLYGFYFVRSYNYYVDNVFLLLYIFGAMLMYTFKTFYVNVYGYENKHDSFGGFLLYKMLKIFASYFVFYIFEDLLLCKH